MKKTWTFYKWFRPEEIRHIDIITKRPRFVGLPNLTGLYFRTRKEALADRKRYANLYADVKFNNFKLCKLKLSMDMTTTDARGETK